MTTDAVNAPPKTWSELEADERLLIMTWMRESIHSGMKKQIMDRTYHSFIRVLHNDGNFDPAMIWSLLPEPTRAHFGHAADILAQLDSDIEFCEDELEREEEDQGDQLEHDQGDQGDQGEHDQDGEEDPQ